MFSLQWPCCTKSSKISASYENWRDIAFPICCCRVILPGAHDDVFEWKHCLRNWPFVRGIHRSPVNSPHKGQWRGALMFSLVCVWINGWVNNREAGDLRRYRTHYDVIVMSDLKLLGGVYTFSSNGFRPNQLVPGRCHCGAGTKGNNMFSGNVQWTAYIVVILFFMY